MVWKKLIKSPFHVGSVVFIVQFSYERGIPANHYEPHGGPSGNKGIHHHEPFFFVKFPTQCPFEHVVLSFLPKYSLSFLDLKNYYISFFSISWTHNTKVLITVSSTQSLRPEVLDLPAQTSLDGTCLQVANH